MKRLFIAVLAMASLVACNKNEVLETVSPDAITFEGAWVGNATRAAIDPSYSNDPNASNPLNSFEVYGFMDEPSGVVFDKELVSRTGATTWTYANLQYWAPKHEYYFAALAPAGGYSLVKSTVKEDAVLGVGEVTFVQPDEVNKVGTVDLIYAKEHITTPDNTSYGEVVKLNFSHLLSKVKFSFTNGFTNDNATIRISDIKMTVPAKGTIDLATPDWNSAPEKWILEAGKTTTMLFGGMGENERILRGKKEESTHERLTFPTPDTQEYEVSFHAQLYYGTELAYKSDLTTTITGAKLEMGKAYNFHAIINNENIAPGNEILKPIEFTVQSIDSWVDGNGYDGGEIVTGPFDVNSTADLYNALEAINAASTDPNNPAPAAAVINVNDDIDLNQPFTKADQISMPCIEVTNNLVFNIADGKTITGGLFAESDGAINEGTSDSYVFWVKEGGNLTINGNGNITTQACKFSIAVWADGGKVTINGGTYTNAGEGSDLIYAKNGGKVAIYGGEFKACEKQPGVPGTKEKYSALNLHDGTDGNEIIVYGGKFYGFDPANNTSEGDETNFVASGYMSVPAEDATYGYVYTVVPQKFEVGNEAELFAAVTAAKAAQNPTITLTNNVTVSTTVNVDCKLNLNLNGYTLTNKLANENTDVIVVTSTGDLTVYGEGTVEAVTGNDGYAIISEGTLTINEGTYKSGIDANGDPNAVIYARGNGKVYVNGGNFPNDNASKFVLNKKDGDRANTVIEVKGGSYGLFNPANNAAEGANTSFLAAGYNVVKTVVDDMAVYTVLAPACTLAEDAAAVTIFNVAGTLDGNGKTLTIDEVERGQFLKDNTLRLLEAKDGAIIKNLNIDGKNAKYGDSEDPYGIRGIYMVEAGTYTIDNVHFKDVTYTINDNSTAPKTFNISNSTFEGWTSYNPATTATFTNVKFQVNVDGYGTFRPHGTTTLTNCDFADGFVLLLDKIGDRKITLNNCTYNGTAITAENLTQIWPEIVVDAVVFPAVTE